MKNEVRLTASATSALPRSVLLIICISYAVTGLFGRDPWKGDDVIGFGVMFTLAHSPSVDWLFPNAFGRSMMDVGPLMYWLGAIAIQLTQSIVGAVNASRIPTALLFLASCNIIWYSSYLLGRRTEVQPFKYAFGGEPLPKDYGRTLADGALLILLACFGLAEQGHQSTSSIAQLFSISIIIFGLIRLTEKPMQGALIWGIGIGLLTLSSTPIVSIFVVFGCLLVSVCHQGLSQQWRYLWFVGSAIAVIISLSWPIAAWLASPQRFQPYLNAWTPFSINEYFNIQSADALLFSIKNLPLFTWPAWPLAAWSLWQWRSCGKYLHLAAPLAVVAPLFLLIFLKNHSGSDPFILLLPGLAILATFALPTLKRAVINAIDWFAILSFTAISSFVWLVWLASLTGHPAPLAHNVNRLLPGLSHQFAGATFAVALAASICWIYLVRWRISRSPKVLWRSVVLSSAGTTLMWVLLMTLWLPLINYSRSYRPVANQLSTYLPKTYRCIVPIDLGDAQFTSFAYFAHLRFSTASQRCDWVIRQDQRDNIDPFASKTNQWELVWEGRRAADRRERFRLYQRKSN